MIWARKNDYARWNRESYVSTDFCAWYLNVYQPL
jgi:hypothetical protein